MPAVAFIHFSPFHLDLADEQLWRGAQQLALRPKPFALLRYLVENPGRLVTKEELRKAVWPDAYVSEGLLNTYIRDLRKVLGDDPETPRFIETVVRRGYRFIAPLTAASPVASLQFQVPSSDTQHSGLSTQHSVLVGREPELAQLHQWLERAVAGERQVVFVTGEPGIGKTTLVEAFLQHIAAGGEVWVGRGQCIEHYGAGEAYLPVLEALGRLCRTRGGERLVPILGRHAPSWLVQMPALASEAELEGLRRKVQGATQQRMLREIAEALEVLTAEQPLVLVVEDLQWGDYSTLDFLTVLAQRREAARLLLIGTYRLVDIIVSGHPLKGVKQELQAHRQCEELALGCLSEAAVAEYLARRFAGDILPPQLARVIHRRTEGNPLFLVNVVEYLLAQDLVREVAGQWQLQATPEDMTAGIPDSLRQLIEKQLERLTLEEQRVLEVASVAGAEFSALAVAVGGEENIEQIEARCEGLVRRKQFLQASGTETGPDGTLTGRYSFSHALYQSVLYERVAAIRRIRLHRRIGERLEEVYGTRAGEIAAELAVHFEQGQDSRRAIQYLQQAAQNAQQRSAHREAIQHLTKALELLKTLPDTPERAQQELTLQVALGLSLTATTSWAAPEVERAYARAQELCHQVGETPQLSPTLRGLFAFYFTRAEYTMARELGERLLSLAQSGQSSAFLLEAHHALGETLSHLGEFAAARVHLEQGIALHDPQAHRSLSAATYGFDLRASCLTFLSLVFWFLGYPDQALKRVHEAIALAQELSHPFSLALALDFAARLCLLCGESQAAQEWAEAAVALCTEQGFPFWLAWGTIVRGRALAEQGQTEGVLAQIQQGLAVWRATGAEELRPYFLALLAEAYGKVGQVGEGLTAVAEALAIVDRTGERFYEAELYRLKGQLTLQSRQVEDKSKTSQDKSGVRSPESEAEVCFHKAIDIARKQGAKSLELRAVVSLARLWQQQGKKKKARQLLAEIYGWFTEGFDTADLREARKLLDELS